MPQLELAMAEELPAESPLPDLSVEMQHHLLETALRMEVTARCQRAYVHDLNNSLQPVFAGVEMLIRAATVGTLAPIEKVVDFAKLAMSQHKLAVTDLIGTLIGPDGPAVVMDLDDLLQKLIAFLTHDASKHQVTLSLQTGAAVQVHVQSSKLRLMFLALLLDAIDAQAAGGSVDIDVAHEPGFVTIAVTDSRPGAAESLLSRPHQHDSLRAVLLMPVLRRSVAQQGGRVDLAAPAGRHSVRIRLPQIG